MTARTELEDALKKHVPKGWRVAAVDTNLDVIKTTTVILSQREVSSFPPAPIAAVEVRFDLEVTTPFEGRPAAELTLDAAIVELLLIFRTLRLRFDTAVKSVEENRLTYTIPVYVIASKEN